MAPPEFRSMNEWVRLADIIALGEQASDTYAELFSQLKSGNITSRATCRIGKSLLDVTVDLGGGEVTYLWFEREVCISHAILRTLADGQHQISIDGNLFGVLRN